MRRIQGFQSIVGALVVCTATAPAVFGQCYQREHQELTGENGGRSGDGFGRGIAADGGTLLVGVPGEPQLHAYEFDGSEWILQQILDAPPTSTGSFGTSIALEGDLAAVLTSSSHSTIELYRRDPLLGWAWFQSLDPIPIDAADGDEVGPALALANGVVFAGAPEQGPGRVFVFEESAIPGVWEQATVLWPADAEEGDRFGESLDAEGDLLAVGAPYTGPREGAGAAFVFQHDTTSGTWERVRKITREGDDYDLGRTVALEGPDLFASDWKRVHVYRFDGSTWTWAQDLDALDGGSGFGYAIRAKGGIVAIGSIDYPRWERVQSFHSDGTQWLEAWSCVWSPGGWGGENPSLALDGCELLSGDSFGGPGRVLAFRLSRLALGFDAEVYYPGDDLRIQVRPGRPQAPLALLVVAVNGSPFLQTLATGRFDAEHQWRLETIVPPGLSGMALTFLAAGVVDPEAVEASLPITVELR